MSYLAIFRHTVHTSSVYLSETGVPQPWLGALPEKVLEFRVSKLV